MVAAAATFTKSIFETSESAIVTCVTNKPIVKIISINNILLPFSEWKVSFTVLNVYKKQFLGKVQFGIFMEA